MKVFVYWNLHKKCWSVRDEKTKKIAHHLTSLVLTNCRFKVSEAGRQRVLREKQKNVHAGVVGFLVDKNVDTFNGKRISYNPYKTQHFLCADQPIFEADLVSFHDDRLVYMHG